MTIRILVADDQPLVSAGISALLDADPDIDVVAQTVMAAVVDAAAAHLPDVVVMNVPADGADVITKVIACSGARVLVVATHATAPLVCDVLLAGAAGYLLTATASSALVGVVHTILGPGTWLDPAVVTELLRELAHQPIIGESASAVRDRLTSREQEVLVLMAAGRSNTEIAEQLFISTPTARTHVGRVLTKLGAPNRAHAVAMAYRLGLVRISPLA